MMRRPLAIGLLVLALWPGGAAARSLEEVRLSGELRLCLAGSSASFYQANGEAFAAFLGVTAKTVKLADWDQQFQNASGVTVKEATYEARPLADGSCDVFPNDLHIVDWRQTKMLLVPYYQTRKVVVAHRDLRHRLKAIGDLAGHRAAVQKGTAYDTWLQEQNKGAFAGQPVTLTYAPTAEAIKLVADRQADFTVVGAEGAFKWVRGDVGTLDILFPVDAPVAVGWGVSPSATGLAAELARFFDDSTRLGSALDRSWQRHYGISLMEYRLFDASFETPGVDIRSILNWLLPPLAAIVLLLSGLFLWNRRLNRAIAVHRRVEGELRHSQALLARETDRRRAVADISVLLRQAATAEQLGQALLSGLARHLPVGQGLFCLADRDGAGLAAVARIGGDGASASEVLAGIPVTENLVSLCAANRGDILVENVAETDLRLSSSLCTLEPAAILIHPVVFAGRLYAVVELALHRPAAEVSRPLLEELDAIVAMSLDVIAQSELTRASLAMTTMLEERGRLILGAVNDGILGMDGEGRVTFANPAVARLLGYSEDELLGAALHPLVHHHYPDGRAFPRCDCAMYHTTVDGRPRTVDTEVLWRKDGAPVPVEYATTPIFKEGQLVGTVVTFRDLTGRGDTIPAPQGG